MRIAALFLSLVFALAGPVLAQGPDSTSVQQQDRGQVTIGAGTTSATTTGSSGPPEEGKDKADSYDPESDARKPPTQQSNRTAAISPRCQCHRPQERHGGVTC